MYIIGLITHGVIGRDKCSMKVYPNKKLANEELQRILQDFKKDGGAVIPFENATRLVNVSKGYSKEVFMKEWNMAQSIEFVSSI